MKRILLTLTAACVFATSISVALAQAPDQPQSVTAKKAAVQQHRSGKELCKSHYCKRRMWRKHHPRPRMPRYRAFASMYGNGDGFLGGPLACGGRYNASDMGVAHKSLPCGTRLRICNPRNHRCANVRVRDRGPYVGGRDFDLQVAPARKIGFSGIGEIRWSKR